MKTMFIQARSPVDVRLSTAALKTLTKAVKKQGAKGKGTVRYGVATTIQHLHKIRDVLVQLPGSILVGQVLGCRADAVKIQAPKVDAFLYVGTGEFHPIRIALEAERAAKEAGGKKGAGVAVKPVFCYDPQAKKLFRLPQKRIDDHLKRVRGQLLRFYHAKTVGLLVTTKKGQNAGRISTFSLKEKMGLPFEFMKRQDGMTEGKNDGKKYYLFAVETLDHQRLEDFTFIDCWVNFACNRIVDDRNMKIVNASDIIEAESE